MKRGRSRSYQYRVIAGGLVAVALVFALHPLPLTVDILLLVLLGAIFASRAVVIGERVHMSVSHPFIFAALVLEGPSAATVVCLVTILSAALFKTERMRVSQLLFNLSSISVSSIGSWLVYSSLLQSQTDFTLETAAVPVLLASIAFYVLNTVVVAEAISLDSGEPFFKTWYENVFWSGASFVAGGALGLIIAQVLRQWGGVSLLLALPFCYLIHYSYKLYLARLSEKQQRLEEVEGLNVQLRAQTEKLLDLNGKLETSNRQLARADSLKSELVANVTHELRTPLNAIIGFAELLKSQQGGALSEENLDCSEQIHDAGQSILGLVDDLLDLSKITAGHMTIEMESCDPAGMVRSVLATLEPTARTKGIDVHLDCQGQFDWITADPVRVSQILYNLNSNAIKFTPQGGMVRVSVERHEDRVSFAVSDTGIGIAPDHLEMIFEPFSQVDGSHTRQYGGTGLGLALSSRLAELLGGELRVSSEPGRGSTFTLELPSAGVAPADAASTVGEPKSAELADVSS